DAITWIDDSIATTPQASIEALRSLSGRSVSVILGGFERGLDWQAFAEFVQGQPPHSIIANGASRRRIAPLLGAHEIASKVFCAGGLAAAAARARRVAEPGGVILLAPGAPSFEQFHDDAERGCRFAELAGFDGEQVGEIEGLGIC